MKDKRFLLGMLVMVVVFGMTVVVCDNDPNDENSKGNDIFAGTWEGKDATYDTPLKIVAENGTFKQWINNRESIRGTYTVSGNNVTVKFFEVNKYIFTYSGPDHWVFFAQLDETEKAGLGGSDTIQANISNNTITMLGATLTKKGNGNNNGNGFTGDTALNGTWVDVRDSGIAKFIFNNGNYEFTEFDNQPGEKGTYTTNNGQLTLAVTHIGGVHLVEMADLLNFEPELDKYYSMIEIKSLVDAEFFIIMASEAGMDPDTFQQAPVTYSVNDNTFTYSETNYTKLNS